MGIFSNLYHLFEIDFNNYLNFVPLTFSTMNSPKIKSKLPHAVTTIFTEMNQVAQKYQALNLAQGFPDFEVSPRLISLVSSYMQKGFNQYAPMQGALPREPHKLFMWPSQP